MLFFALLFCSPLILTSTHGRQRATQDGTGDEKLTEQRLEEEEEAKKKATKSYLLQFVDLTFSEAVIFKVGPGRLHDPLDDLLVDRSYDCVRHLERFSNVPYSAQL